MSEPVAGVLHLLLMILHGLGLAPPDHVVHGPLGEVVALRLDLLQGLDDMGSGIRVGDGVLRIVQPLSPLPLEVPPHLLDGVEL